MYQCPITYFTDNLIFGKDKDVWAAYKLTGYDYDFLDDEAKVRILMKMSRFLCGILSEAQILILPIEQDNKEHFHSLKKRMAKEDPLYESAVFHADETEKYLEQLRSGNGDVNDYRSYILIKLAENNEFELVESIRQGVQYFFRDPVNAVHVFFDLDTRDILESRLVQCKKMAEKWLFSQSQKMKLMPIDTKEVQWLLKRGAFRGISQKAGIFYGDEGKGVWEPAAEWVASKDQTDKKREAILRPLSRDIVSLFTGTIYQENRCLRIVHDRDRVSYQTFLVLTNIPEVLEHPGNEWLYMLQLLNEQAEVCIHIKSNEYRSAIKKVERKKMEIESQMEHIQGANADIPDDLAEGKEYADLLEAEIKGQRAPILDTSITICLAASDPEELEKKAVTIRGIYEDMSFGVERPLADQLKLYLQCIPAAGILAKEYTIPLTPQTLSSGIIGATHELGDHRGAYIGTTGAEGKHVFLDLGLACLLNRSASATFYGNLGVGKSFNANLLLFLTVLYGGYGLIFDPKGERSHWERLLTVFEGQITTVTLSSDPENKGKMDPYNMYPDDPDEADELALNIIAELLKIQPASMEYTAILEAQRMMRTSQVPSMMRLIEKLRSFDEEDELKGCARFLARRLGLQAESGMSKLLFGDGSEEAISLENRLNILQIENLKLPSPTTAKENYTNEENLSTVLMAAASHFAKKFALVKRPVFKVILFDESWMLGKTVEGVKLFDFLSRMGRSLYTGCIFNGHSVLDIPNEGIRNTISYKFCFQTNNDSEAARMCEYMGLEPTQENKDIIKDLGNGECLFQDLSKHVGVLKFDAVFQDIIEVFSTTPKTAEDDGSLKPEDDQEESRTAQYQEEGYPEPGLQEEGYQEAEFQEKEFQEELYPEEENQKKRYQASVEQLEERPKQKGSKRPLERSDQGGPEGSISLKDQPLKKGKTTRAGKGRPVSKQGQGEPVDIQAPAPEIDLDLHFDLEELLTKETLS